MRKRTVQFTEGEIGKVKVVKDFLPRPDQLVLREEREENVIARGADSAKLSS